jgi:predicted nuclease with TOPRIM domain
MSKRIATAIDELQSEETRIQADLDDLRQRVKSGENQLKRIQKALSVLEEKPRQQSASKKPASTRREVIAAMVEILSTTGPVEEAKLKQLVANKIASQGKSRMGFALRFTEALHDKRFQRDEDGLIVEDAKPVSV